MNRTMSASSGLGNNSWMRSRLAAASCRQAATVGASEPNWSLDARKTRNVRCPYTDSVHVMIDAVLPAVRAPRASELLCSRCNEPLTPILSSPPGPGTACDKMTT